MKPKITPPPSEWLTHQVDAVDWYKSLKDELRQIEEEQKWKDSCYYGS